MSLNTNILAAADTRCEVQPQAVLPLQEYKDHGTFRGCCSVGFRWQDMENQHLREHFKVSRPTQTRWPPGCECLQQTSVLGDRGGHGPAGAFWVS